MTLAVLECEEDHVAAEVASRLIIGLTTARFHPLPLAVFDRDWMNYLCNLLYSEHSSVVICSVSCGWGTRSATIYGVQVHLGNRMRNPAHRRVRA